MGPRINFILARLVIRRHLRRIFLVACGYLSYTATHANASLPGTKIEATATDLPGNTGTLAVTL